MSAQEILSRALVSMLNRSAAPPCRADLATLPRWTSDDPGERQWAAWHCQPCTILAVCHAAADEGGERWGVWAGVDRTPPKQILPGRWPR